MRSVRGGNFLFIVVVLLREEHRAGSGPGRLTRPGYYGPQVGPRDSEVTVPIEEGC